MLFKNNEEFYKMQSEILERLNSRGIKFREGKKVPLNRNYSGVLSSHRKVLKLNIPSIILRSIR